MRDQARSEGGRSGGVATAHTRLERPRALAEARRAAPASSETAPASVVQASGIPLLPPKTRLGRYFIVRHIKSGGMGAVYRAEDPETGQVVAIKTMVAEVGVKSEAYARFLREVQAACTVRHRNVIQIFGFDVHAGMPYVIMEYLRGQGLNDLVAQGPLPIDRAADIVAAVCAAMGAVHDHHIIHRDLKPSNIFLAETDEGEQVKVLDFGVSKLRTATDMTASNTIIGSVHYMSPEQVRGLEVDARSDQFAVGAVLYECLTGQRPHTGETLFEVSDAIIHGRRRPVRALRPEIPPTLEAILCRVFDPDPARRFASVRELGAALLAHASPEGQRQLADLLSKGSLKLRRGRPSAPMPAAWFKTNGTAGIPRPVASAETRLLPTAPIPRDHGVEATGDARTNLDDTRSLPGDFGMEAPVVSAPPLAGRSGRRGGVSESGDELLSDWSAEWQAGRPRPRRSGPGSIAVFALGLSLLGGALWFFAGKPIRAVAGRSSARPSAVPAAPVPAPPTIIVPPPVPISPARPVAALSLDEGERTPAATIASTGTGTGTGTGTAPSPTAKPTTRSERSRDRRRSRPAPAITPSDNAPAAAATQAAAEPVPDDGVLIIE